MASLLFQTIEQISREKHIEPEVIVAAIEDAMVVAARKYYKTDEDMRSRFNPDTGHVDVFTVRTVVEEVADPPREISVADARRHRCQLGGRGQVGHEHLGRGPQALELAGQLVEGRPRPGHEDEIMSGCRQRPGETVAEPRRRPGHQGGLSVGHGRDPTARVSAPPRP